MKNTRETLIVPMSPRCLCSSYLTTQQERKDGLCIYCADAPAVLDVNPCAVVDWAMNKARAEEANTPN